MTASPTPGALVHRGSQTTISLQGELDLYTRDELRRLLYDPDCRSTVVVDLTDTTFIDSSTLTELIRFRRWLDTRGSALRLVGANRENRRVFQVTGLDRVFVLGHETA
jgi:anti-sigma B factor antagonist